MKHDLLIPVRRMKNGDGYFTWPENSVLASPVAEDQLPLGQLKGILETELGISARCRRHSDAVPAVRIDRDCHIADLEGYSIDITRSGIGIRARTGAGAYYAVQTLRELVRVHGRRIPACRIDDEPDFWRRGVYLDCSRGKVPTVDTLKLLVEYLASLKVNELQLYVENVFTFKKHPGIGRGFDPFTPDELLAVQDHCRTHHVRFVPSLTSFGHFEKILRVPGYAHLAESTDDKGVPGGTICPVDPGSIRLVADMYAEFLPLFEAEDFNACGDEPWELGKGRSARRAGEIGVGRVYLEFIKKLRSECLKNGKRMNLWSDIVLNHPEVIPDIPEDIVMLNWDYGPDGSRIPRTHEFRDAGLAVMVCPGTSGWNSHGTRLQTSMDNVSRFAEVGRRNDAEGLLNTDWGDCGHRNPIGASFHGYAHGAAHSWNGRAVNDETFTRTFCHHVLGSDDPALVKFIRDLGSVEITSKTRPFHAFARKLSPDTVFPDKIPSISPIHVAGTLFQGASEAGCKRVIAELRGADRFIRKVRSGDPVSRLVAEDLVLAAHLDTFGCRHVLAGMKVRTGKRLSVMAFDQLASERAEAATALEKNWLKRNKPSRLKDNLFLYTRGIAEYRKLAR